MATTDNNVLLELSADLAEADPERDELGFKDFARSIANGICNMAPVEGLTIAISGNWGAGKTTLMNFIRRYVSQIDGSIEIMDFNPWWFSGHEDLVRKLLQQLSRKCKPDSESGKRLAGLIADYAEAFEKFPVELKTGFGPVSFDATKAAAAWAKSFREGSTIPEFKEKIGKLLRDMQIKYVVIIDDVDRLSVSEIRDLFRAMKAVCDLPNVVYLIALDRDVVAKALDQSFQERGDAYLKKIIQVPFDLPMPSQQGISKIFLSGFNKLLESANIEYLDEDRYWTYYRSGIKHMLETPRDAVRLLNVLCITLPAVRGEVNVADFVAIEACRLFREKLYHRIRSNKDQFAGHISRHLDGDAESLKQFHEATVSTKDEEWQKDFLMELFPKVSKAWRNIGHGSDFLQRWRKELRVCSPDIFDVYFRFSISADDVPSEKLREFIAAVNNGNCKHLILPAATSTNLQDKNRLWALVERMEDHVDELTVLGKRTFFLQMFDVWSQYIEIEGTRERSLVGSGNELSLVTVAFHCLKGLSADDIETSINSVIKKRWCPQILLRLMQNIGAGFGRFGQSRTEEMAIVTAEQFDRIARTLCNMLQDLIDAESLNAKAAARALNFASAMDSSRIPLWVDRLKNSKAGLIGMIGFGASESFGLGGRRNGLRFEFEMDRIGAITNLDQLSQTIRATDFSDMDKRSTLMARDFLSQLDEGTEDA